MSLPNSIEPGEKSPEKRCLASLTDPELIRISDFEQTQSTYGCDQDWYDDHWQRQAGCGPCTAATILYYLSRSRPEMAHLYTALSHAREDFKHFMHEIWHYVTPGEMGVNEASILADGVQAYAAKHSIDLKPAIFKVPAGQSKREPFENFLHFVKTGLDLDSPVAFLNLSNGQLTNLDSWHWVTITGLLAGSNPVNMAIIADSGEYKEIDLELWYKTTLLGGAVVYFSWD